MLLPLPLCVELVIVERRYECCCGSVECVECVEFDIEKRLGCDRRGVIFDDDDRGCCCCCCC